MVTYDASSNGGGVTPIVDASTSGLQVQSIAVKLDEVIMLEEYNMLLPSKYHGIEV